MNEQERVTQVELASQGDQDALQRLIVCYHSALRGVLERETDGPLRRHLDPDDVLQEAYVATFKTVAGCRFDGPGGFYKWLERIARNRLRDQQRALKRQKRDVRREACQQAASTTSYPNLVHRLTSAQSTPTAVREVSAVTAETNRTVAVAVGVAVAVAVGVAVQGNSDSPPPTLLSELHLHHPGIGSWGTRCPGS